MSRLSFNVASSSDTDLAFVLILDGKDKEMKLAQFEFNIGLHWNGVAGFAFVFLFKARILKKHPQTPNCVFSLA